ncbi:hypothetical protein [Actinomadura sp. DC4]|uniref:hypothetical protein n=1 Tax=Actinomadura sp. DC4 TaxID=3055069 RepID=UPI0025B03BF4|nr:hypothetical protein [Actinomadura sp. DC4]MDN3359623.1 hypothetical protein [Actinomadura sp. DC4]
MCAAWLREAVSIDHAVEAALGTTDPENVAEVVAALELAGRLSPEVLSRPSLRPESGRSSL